MLLFKVKHLKKNWFLLANCLILLVGLASCGGSGPKVNVCIVDSSNLMFQCIDPKHKSYVLPLRAGDQLLCASPPDVELFLKACKAHQFLDIPLCSYSSSGMNFKCNAHGEVGPSISILEADNFVCLSPLHRQRLIERCKGSK